MISHARRLLLLLLVLAASCSRPMQFETMRQTWRTPVTLLDVRLVFRVGNHDSARADDQSKTALAAETVLVYPVLKFAFGDKQQDVRYLANTPRIASVARDSAAGEPGWQMTGRLDIEHKLRDDLRVDWYEVIPRSSRLRPREPVRYTVRPLNYHDWCLELTGRPGVRRFRVRVTYGRQMVTSSCVYFESAIRQVPPVVVHADSSNAGWSGALLGALPYREGSTRRQVADMVTCDSRGLVTYGLEHIGYDSTALDSGGALLFEGYIRHGQLYDASGRRAGLKLGTDLKRGDVIHFTTLHQYGVIHDDAPRSGWRYGGIPARLPVLRAFRGYPEVKPLWAILWNLRTLFGRNDIRILRFAPIAPPPPVMKKPRRAAPPAAKPAGKPAKTRAKARPASRR